MPQGLLPFSSEHPHQRYVVNQAGLLARIRRRFFYLLGGNSRKLKTLFILLLSLSLVFYLCFFFFVNNNDNIIEETPNILLPDSLVEKRLDFEVVTIDKICSRLSSICYSVVDRRRDNGQVERHLIFDHSLPDDSDSMVYLVAPKGETFDSSDTRIWNIDHGQLASQYIAGMLIAPFITNVLPLNDNGSNKSIIEIGLGGGSLDMALHAIKPKMKITAIEIDPTILHIAEKWFGVVNDAYRTSVVDDGITFLAKMIRHNQTVDVIMVDACDDILDLPCPSKAFRQQETIQLLKKAISPNGVVVINVLAHDKDGADGANAAKVMSAYKNVFPTCVRIKMTIEINTVLICLQTIANLGDQMSLYNNRLKSAVSTLGLEYILGDCTVSHIF